MSDTTLVRIILACTQEQKQAAYRLRYDVCITELAKRMNSVDYEARIVVDDLDRHSHIFLAILDDEIIGTARLSFWRDIPLGSYEQFYNLREWCGVRQQLGIITRLVVQKHIRRLGVALQLTSELYRFALNRGILLAFCHCTPGLTAFYEHLGWRRYCEPAAHPESGCVDRLLFLAHDVEHLERCQSPFLAIYRDFERTNRNDLVSCATEPTIQGDWNA